MLGWIRRTLGEIARHKSGNAALMVALGLPALIGGAGLAVDTSQWFLWKRELQFAVDQAALAGAWARTNNSSREAYSVRASQEYNANTQTIKAFASVPTISLVNYNGGTANAVRVIASATRKLPFSSLLTSRNVTIKSYAQASVTEGGIFYACLRATDTSDYAGAVDLTGSIIYRAGCGISALSTSANSIRAQGINANDIDPGILMSRGGIDSWFSSHGYETKPYFQSLSDPFASLTPPTNSTPRTYSCTPAGTVTTATTVVRTVIVDKAYTGTKSNAVTTLVSTTPVSDETVGPTANVTVPTGTTNGTPPAVETPTPGTVTSTGSGNNKVFYRTDRVKTVTTTYSNVVATTTTRSQASLLPGTYDTLFVSCDTVFSPGIYVVNGGRLKITSGYNVTGSGVMFVLKSGAYIDIQGNSTVTLSGPSATQLESWGVSSANAADLEGMLIFEDRYSSGSNNKNTINGTTDTVLNGTVYLPVSDITLNGTATVTSRCLTISAFHVKVGGNANFTNFCPGGLTYDEEVARSDGSVRLVS